MLKPADASRPADAGKPDAAKTADSGKTDGGPKVDPVAALELEARAALTAWNGEESWPADGAHRCPPKRSVLTTTMSVRCVQSDRIARARPG